MQKALKSAGISPSEVGGLFAHATATPKGDTAEINAINLVHGKASRRAAPLPVTGLKGHTGHSGASSGGMALIEGLMGMADGRFAHTANTTDPDPHAEFEIVTGKPKDQDFDVVQVNSFGFGGQNASMIVTRS